MKLGHGYRVTGRKGSLFSGRMSRCLWQWLLAVMSRQGLRELRRRGNMESPMPVPPATVHALHTVREVLGYSHKILPGLREGQPRRDPAEIGGQWVMVELASLCHTQTLLMLLPPWQETPPLGTKKLHRVPFRISQVCPASRFFPLHVDLVDSHRLLRHELEII